MYHSILLCFVFVALVVAVPRNCTDAEKLSWKGYLSKSETTDTRYQSLNCCHVRSISGSMGSGSDVRVVTFRYWACPPGAISERPNNDATPSRVKRFALQTTGGGSGENDESIEIVETQDFVPWNIDRMDQRNLPRNGVYYPKALPPYDNQKEVHVYVVGTGLDPTHDVFAQVEISMDYPSAEGAIDCNGHETHVTSLIIAHTVGVLATSTGQVETRAKVVVHVVSVLKCTGTGTTFDVIEGLLWIKQNGQNNSVINLSLGSPKSPSLNDVLDAMAHDNGYAIIAAAGNNNIDACETSPSSATSAISVGASREDDQKASYSNVGPCIKIFAPGNNIYGAMANSSNKLILMSGTSMASPAVAGATLRCQLQMGSDALSAFYDCVLPQTTNNVLTNIGAESPNKLAFVGVSGIPETAPNPYPAPGPAEQPGVMLPPPNIPVTSGTIRQEGDYVLVCIVTVIFLVFFLY